MTELWRIRNSCAEMQNQSVTGLGLPPLSRRGVLCKAAFLRPLAADMHQHRVHKYQGPVTVTARLPTPTEQEE